jgi:release factor glutamine methyltransferase
MLHLLGKNKAWLITHPDKELTDAETTRFLEMLERRHRGEPMQYIFGETEFYRMPFLVTPEVLIPRPETEHLVERVCQLIPALDNRPKAFLQSRVVHQFSHSKKSQRIGNTRSAGWPPRILDIGTGSGAIPISIAHDWSEAEITAIDASETALDVARRNAERLGFADQIRFLQGDLLDPVAGEQFDIVVSNPPYVPETDRPTLSVEVRDYEPGLALFAGNDGLDIYRRLIPQAFLCLVSGGFIALEIGYGQSEAIAELLTAAGFRNIEFTPDLQGIPRVAAAQRP